jgi:queuine tRNA-ribosyltransferase
MRMIKPLDEGCRCPACSNYSRSVFASIIPPSQEMISNITDSINPDVFQDIMAGMRDAVATQSFAAWGADFHAGRAQAMIH